MSEFLFDLDFDSKTFNKIFKCLQIVSFQNVKFNFETFYFYLGGGCERLVYLSVVPHFGRAVSKCVHKTIVMMYSWKPLYRLMKVI